MIIISKKERQYLESIGAIFGKDIHKTYCGHRQAKYYMTETEWLLNKLNDYRNSRIIYICNKK